MLISKLFRTASTSMKSGMNISMKTLSNNFSAGFASNVMEATDIIEDIKDDHRKLEECYRNYKSASTVDEGKKWFNQFLWEICRHSVAEEMIVYNLMEAQGERGKQLSEASREGHRKLKVMLEDLRHEKDEAAFDKKMDAVMDELMDHIKLEEGEDLPYLQEKVSPEVRKATAKAFALKKNLTPTRPHPEIPDKPTALEAALGLLVTPVDKLRDIFTPFPDQKK